MAKTNLFKSLQTIVIITIFMTIVIFIGSSFVFRYIDLQRQIHTTQKDHIEREKHFVKQGINNFIELIKNKQDQTNERAHSVLKERIEGAHKVATSLYTIYKDEKSDEEIQSIIIENLRSIQFNGGLDYFFILTTKGDAKLTPINASLEGSNILSVTNSRNRHIFQDMLAIAQKGEGFYAYTWDHPHLEGNDHLKLSYLKTFEPYDWIIGTGIYIDEIIDTLKKEALEIAENYQFGDKEAHYIYIGQWDGTILYGPAKGKNMWDITDVNGLKIVQELIKKSQDEGGFVTFQMPAIEGLRSATKMGYAQGLHAWEWYIGSGLYLDKVHEEVTTLKEKLLSDFYKNLLLATISTVFVILFFIYILNRYHVRLQNDFETFKHFFIQATDTHQAIDKTALTLEEFDALAEHANRMLQEQSSLESSLKKLAAVFENTHEGIIICSPQHKIIQANRAFCRATGYSEQELLGKKISSFRSHHHDISFYRDLLEKVAIKGSWQGELWNKRKDGSSYPTWLTINSSFDKNMMPDHYIGVFSDISHLKESQKELNFLAHHDPLTKLPNRALFNDRLAQSIKNAERHNHKLALCFIDLDNFKNVNDSYGHSYGDEILLQVSKRLKEAVRKSDTLARVGGDEFVLIINDITQDNDPSTIVSKLLTLFDGSFHVKEHTFFITASIGISMYPDDGETYETLIKNADAAMYQAKSHGKNTFSFYTQQLTQTSKERLQLENDLKHALVNDEFSIHYQPQIDLKKQTLLGLEALLRWKHPTLGYISPNKFIPLAEETRMIIPLGEYVLHQACKDWMALSEKGFDGHIAINISGVQIDHSDFLKTLDQLTHKMPFEKLELEITESTLMREPQKWITLLKKIKQRRIKISIDDFGTGYSSLNHLRYLPIDKLKIDLSFVQHLPYDKSACAIATSIIDLAENMQMQTLAEGIETLGQMDYLTEIECQGAQGYLIAKPMPLDELEKWILTSPYSIISNDR